MSFQHNLVKNKLGNVLLFIYTLATKIESTVITRIENSINKEWGLPKNSLLRDKFRLLSKRMLVILAKIAIH